MITTCTHEYISAGIGFVKCHKCGHTKPSSELTFQERHDFGMRQEVAAGRGHLWTGDGPGLIGRKI